MMEWCVDLIVDGIDVVLWVGMIEYELMVVWKILCYWYWLVVSFVLIE